MLASQCVGGTLLGLTTLLVCLGVVSQAVIVVGFLFVVHLVLGPVPGLQPLPIAARYLGVVLARQSNLCCPNMALAGP